jgi:hypothetical protein
MEKGRKHVRVKFATFECMFEIFCKTKKNCQSSRMSRAKCCFFDSNLAHNSKDMLFVTPQRVRVYENDLLKPTKVGWIYVHT